MQVSQIAELNSHAVIGGGAAQAFSISESAEFFTVLSDTLYRDKIRAVVREVICNAWDAHIMAGKTDLPIEISLSDNEIKIQDFGPGISEERIVPIYCVYGNSTKAADGTQTGGFGLGSKAPFAYSPHFSVTSCHNGTKIKYAVSRGGTETDGKPDIRAMVKVATTESGITVTIPIRTNDDKLSFQRHIFDVIFQGGMLANLNGTRLPTINYEPARKLGFCLIRLKSIHEAVSGDLSELEKIKADYVNGLMLNHNMIMRESQVYVLYGTVLYPVSGSAELDQEIGRLNSLIPHGYRMIILAKPDTIGVTPSREALSFSETTVDTITKAVSEIHGMITKEAATLTRKIMTGNFQAKSRYGFVPASAIPASRQIDLPQFVSSVNDMARYAANASLHIYARKEQRQKVASLLMAKVHRNDRRYFRRLAYSDSNSKTITGSDFLHSSRLHLRAAAKVGLLSDLSVYQEQYWESNSTFTPYSEYEPSGTAEKVLIVANSQKAAIKEIASYKKQRTRAKNPVSQSTYIVLFVRRDHKGVYEAIKSACLAHGLPVIFSPLPKKMKKTERAKNGQFYSLHDVKYAGRSSEGLVGLEKSLDKPKCYVSTTGSHEEIRGIKHLWDMRDSLREQFGDIAISLSPKTDEKLKAKGAVNIVQLLMDRIEKLSDDKNVQLQSIVARGGLVSTDRSHYYYSIPTLVNALTAADARFLKLFFGVEVRQTKAFKETGTLVQALKGSRHLLKRELAVRYNDLESNLYKKARRTFDDISVSGDEVNARFSYLQPLQDLSCHYSELNDNQMDEVFGLIRDLKRKHSIKTKNSIVKEAA